MIRIAVVEDDTIFSECIKEYLRRYKKEKGKEFQVTSFRDGDELLENYRADYDLLLMDIEMQFMDGMTAAREVRKMDSEVDIVFITNMPQYAMEGYKVSALDYVLKPISYFAFSAMMDEALRRIRKNESRYITISIKNGIQKIKTSEITYVEVSNHDLLIHTINGNYETKKLTISGLEEQLQGTDFFRCNKCFLINLKYVERIQRYDVWVCGDRIQVSQKRKKPLMEALNAYMNEVEG